MQPLGHALGFFIRMDPLQMSRKLGGDEFERLGRTNLHTLGPALPVAFTQVADHGTVFFLGIKTGDRGGTGIPAQGA